MAFESYGQIWAKSSNIKFYENPSSGSRLVPCGRTDGQAGKQTWRSHFRNTPNNWQKEMNFTASQCSWRWTSGGPGFQFQAGIVKEELITATHYSNSVPHMCHLHFLLLLNLENRFFSPYVGFQVLPEVTTNSAVLRNLALCSLTKNWSMFLTCYLHSISLSWQQKVHPKLTRRHSPTHVISSYAFFLK